MFAGKKSAQIREILISESTWEEMTCLFAPSLVIFVCQRIEWRYIFSTNTGHPLKNTCEMTGTDFSTDGLMRRYVTGGNNQWHTVASLHMTIMMNRIGTVADRQPKARKVKHGEMT